MAEEDFMIGEGRAELEFHEEANVDGKELEGVEGDSAEEVCRKLPSPSDAGGEGVAADTPRTSIHTDHARWFAMHKEV